MQLKYSTTTAAFVAMTDSQVSLCGSNHRCVEAGGQSFQSKQQQLPKPQQSQAEQ